MDKKLRVHRLFPNKTFPSEEFIPDRTDFSS